MFCCSHRQAIGRPQHSPLAIYTEANMKQAFSIIFAMKVIVEAVEWKSGTITQAHVSIRQSVQSDPLPKMFTNAVLVYIGL